MAICLEELGVEEIRAIHVPGKANVEADFLSRPSTSKTTTMPKALEGVDIRSELGPGSCFYPLPTPREAPGLWGTKGERIGQGSSGSLFFFVCVVNRFSIYDLMSFLVFVLYCRGFLNGLKRMFIAARRLKMAAGDSEEALN